MTLDARGYDGNLLADWAARLDFTPASFASREVFVAEVDGEVVACAALLPQGAVCILDDLWVDPSSFNCGFGTKLFRRCVERARERGVRRREWEAEPNAVAFYEKMVGRRLREHTSAWGRQTPWMGLRSTTTPASLHDERVVTAATVPGSGDRARAPRCATPLGVPTRLTR